MVKHVRTNFSDQAFRVVRYIECILPSVTFLESAPYLHRIEVLDKRTILLFRTDKITGRVIDTLPAFR